MMEESFPEELDNELDEIEPVGDEAQLYEHFRVVVDKGQSMVRLINICSNALSMLPATVSRKQPKTDS
ncbi:ribosomal large subunit pseudouridine synthase D [Bacteroides pyogenes JCM 6292]|uniref:Ribosomal large subunit pseudouridine synthase D n=1 Tax=Bacteroides pyogenes JCM 6292 TaxID=1235809 RepID=W4PAB9_9BACE|nr:ribosomal large subunit pseudouridine synthase D [Bacteroides pyogenes JCM 6292]